MIKGPVVVIAIAQIQVFLNTCKQAKELFLNGKTAQRFCCSFLIALRTQSDNEIQYRIFVALFVKEPEVERMLVPTSKYIENGMFHLHYSRKFVDVTDCVVFSKSVQFEKDENQSR